MSSYKTIDDIQKKSMGQTVQFRILNSLQCGSLLPVFGHGRVSVTLHLTCVYIIQFSSAWVAERPHIGK